MPKRTRLPRGLENRPGGAQERDGFTLLQLKIDRELILNWSICKEHAYIYIYPRGDSTWSSHRWLEGIISLSKRLDSPDINVQVYELDRITPGKGLRITRANIYDLWEIVDTIGQQFRSKAKNKQQP